MSESEMKPLSDEELTAEGGTALPDKEVISLLDLNADLDLGLDAAAPIDLAVAANANVAAPIDAAVGANVLSVGSQAQALADQGVVIDQGITVNTVLPGGVATPGSIGAKGPAPEGPGRRAPPLGLCDPTDIGDAVLFFASDLAAKVTNQSLAVDAGWSVT